MPVGVMRLLAVVLVMACGGMRAGAEGAGPKWPATWRATELRDHALVGRIYDVAAARFIDPETYLSALARTHNVLLGEVHDNPDHHVLQALAVERLKPEMVVFEHFRSDQQSIIDAYQAGQKLVGTAGSDDQLERLFLVTQWDKSGWPDKAIYSPLIEAVLASGAKIVAGNVPRRRMMDVARNGLAALSEDARRQMQLDRPLGGDFDDALLRELEASHCGLMAKSAFGNMAVAQRLRDAGMAAELSGLRGPPKPPRVLVAGNGHVRSDRGVPWYLGQFYAKWRLMHPAFLSVAHLEVVEGSTEPATYLETPHQFSFLVFTPRAKRDDPCDAMRERYGKHKRN